jgi:error-prone DNA polymerase
MGFYAPAQLVRDARQHGVEIRPVDVNHSRWDCTLEPHREKRSAVRLGLRMTKGLANADGAQIVGARGEHPFLSIEELWRRAGVPVTALERLAEADGFGSLGLTRREALWIIRGLSNAPLPLFAAADERDGALRPETIEPPVALAPMTAGGEVVEDYRSTGLTLRQHPVSFLRADLATRGIVESRTLRTARDGQRLIVAGLVLVRQKPGSASGVLFVTIEDETDIANLIIWPSLFERQRQIILSAGMVACRGRVQREGNVIHVVAEHLDDLSGLLREVGARDERFPLSYGRGDQAKYSGAPTAREPASRVTLSSDSEAGDPGREASGILIPGSQLAAGIKVKSRNFH